MPINNFLLPGAKVTPAYEVANSCRFAGDAHGQKSISSGGSGTTATFSAWIKPSADPDKALFTSYIDANNFVEIYFSSSKFRVYHYDGGSTVNDIKTNALYRDQSAWYHFHVIFDTANGTEADRIIITVNGTRVTSFATSNYPTSSQDMELNSSSATLNLAARNADEQFLGYMAEVVWLDGTASAVTNFGEFDEDSPNIWKPKNVSGLSSSKGTNGFYCDFEDSSNLGNDVWGGTDFTETNLAATDQATDTPTNNFATLNPLMVPTSNAPTFSEGNCKTATNNAALHQGYSTIAVTKGKWYVECKRISQDSGSGDDGLRIGIGVANNINMETSPVGSSDSGHYIMIGNGTVYNGSNDLGDKAGDSLISDDEIVGIALDLDNDRISWSSNGVWMTGSNAWSGSSPSSYVTLTDPDSTDAGYFFISTDGSTARGYTTAWNFGGCPAFSISSAASDENGYGNFEFAPPSGYYALCTKNLAEFG